MTDRGTITVAAVCLVACLIGSTLMAGRVQQSRSELELVVTTGDTSSMPPHVALVTAALGTFRGLAVDVLWYRADMLQDQGEFYEAQTLSQWITTLQPRFQKVWAFQAWNMAYNIAAATQIQEERWGWVNRGIDLLRSRGIPLNPTAANLYYELAWLFQNKIGRVGDRYHWFYKARFVEELGEILGDMTSGKKTPEAIDRFRVIVDAPPTLAELFAGSPRTADAVQRLQSIGLEPDESLLRMLGRVVMAEGSVDAAVLGRDGLPSGTNLELLKLMQSDKDFATVLIEQVVPHLQRRVLQDSYGMDPEKMLTMMDRYGPLDWRHPLAHGIYWYEQGVLVSRERTRREDINELMLLRSRLLTLMELLRQGRIEFDVATDRIDLLPDPRFAAKYEDAIFEAFDLITSEEGVETAVYGAAEKSDLYATYAKFLNVATMLTFLYGDESEAQRYFTLLRDLMKEEEQGDDPLYAEGLENYVSMRFADQVEANLADLRQFLDAMIRRAFREGLAKGDFRVFNRFLGLAFKVYDKRYAVSRPGEALILKDAALVEFPKIVSNTFTTMMKDREISVLERARVWRWAPDKLKRAAFPTVETLLTEEATQAGIDPALAFPPPPDEEATAEGEPATDDKTSS